MSIFKRPSWIRSWTSTDSRWRHPAMEDDIRRVFPVLSNLYACASSDCCDAEREAALEQSIFGGPGSDATHHEQEQRLGKYTLRRAIGAGGMGVVFEAKRIHSDERVALKIISPVYTSAISLERFEREVRAATMLHHSNIVPVHDFDSEDGTAFFTMRYVDGPNLGDVIHGERSESAPPDMRDKAEQIRARLFQNWSQIAHVICQAARALAHAHAHGVLHRDIKPGNLLVEDNLRVWITDFGVAKFGNELTLTRQAVGTPRYMPPEQLRGKVDTRSDLFALALTLYELSIMASDGDTQRNPYADESALGGLVRPSTLAPGIPAELERIIVKGVSLYPDLRYQTAGEFAEDLKQFIHHCQRNERRRRGRLRRWTKALTALAVGALASAAFLATPEPLPDKLGLLEPANSEIHILENQVDVGAVAATPGHHWSVVGGDDAKTLRFVGNRLQFVEPPNFEAPGDKDRDNRYHAEVQVSDAVGAHRNFALEVQVLNELEPPTVLLDGRIHRFRLGERMERSQLEVSDDEDLRGYGITFHVAGGADEGRIVIDPIVGVPIPRLTDASAGDADNDGVFQVRFEARDRSFARSCAAGASSLALETVDGRREFTRPRDVLDFDAQEPVLGIASSDGKRMFVLRDDGEGTAALWQMEVVEGRTEARLWNSDCGIARTTRGFATANGRQFYVIDDVGESFAVLKYADLNQDYSFTIEQVPGLCTIPSAASSLATLDGRVFYFRMGVDSGSTAAEVNELWSAVLLESGNFVTYRQPIGKRRGETRGEAFWVEQLQGSKATQVQLEAVQRD